MVRPREENRAVNEEKRRLAEGMLPRGISLDAVGRSLGRSKTWPGRIKDEMQQRDAQ